MFGSVAKSWFAQTLGVAPEKIFCVSIMPCVAKKAESELPTMAVDGRPDVDLVLTTRELVRMLRADKLLNPPGELRRDAQPEQSDENERSGHKEIGDAPPEPAAVAVGAVTHDRAEKNVGEVRE